MIEIQEPGSSTHHCLPKCSIWCAYYFDNFEGMINRYNTFLRGAQFIQVMRLKLKT